jgi:hypothetical protein
MKGTFIKKFRNEKISVFILLVKNNGHTGIFSDLRLPTHLKKGTRYYTKKKKNPVF